MNESAVLYTEHHCPGRNSISRLRSQPTEKIYFLGSKFSVKNYTYSVNQKWDYRCFVKIILNFCLFCLLGIKEIKNSNIFSNSSLLPCPPPPPPKC